MNLYLSEFRWGNGKRGHCLPGYYGNERPLFNWFEEAQPCPQAGEGMKSMRQSQVCAYKHSFLHLFFGFGKMETSKIKLTSKGHGQLALCWWKRRAAYPGLRAGGEQEIGLGDPSLELCAPLLPSSLCVPFAKAHPCPSWVL